MDEDNGELLATLALAVAGDTAQRSLLTFLLDPARLRDCDARGGRASWTEASILRWFALQYPDVGGVTIERAAALEEAAAARVVARLRVEVESSDDRPVSFVWERARPGSRSATAASAAREGDRGEKPSPSPSRAACAMFVCRASRGS